MRAKSAGILLYRFKDGKIQFLVCHTGGPYGRRSDKDSWSIPKGGIEEGEDTLDAATRELKEETGIGSDEYGDLFYLGVAKQSRKDVYAYGAKFLSDDDDPNIVSNMTNIEWPRGSGKTIRVPEIDRGEFVSEKVAKYRLIRGQKDLIDLLIKKI
tara:strand:- start:109 stop:573 length:465 start_codon:yes stop_codon:yes gene_type:complete